MANGGRIIWDLDVEDVSFTSGLDKASKQAKSTAGQINKIDFKGIASNASQSFGNIADSIQRTALVAGGLAAAVGGIFIKSAADLQQTSKSFEVLTGNAETANKLFGQLATFANKTPFEFPDIAKAGQTLLGFGIQSDKVFDNVKTLGDVAAATGADFGSLALVFGQVNATGKLMGQDALQLINNRIPILNILSKELGVSVQEVKQRMEEGAISTDLFNKALLKTTQEGGFAFKGTEVLASSLNGRLSTLKDTVLEFGRNLLGVKVDPQLGLVIEPGGIFDRFSLLIPKITESLTAMAPAVVLAFGWIIDHGDLILAVLTGITAAFIAAKVAAIVLAVVALGTLGLAVTGIIAGIGLLAAGAFLLIRNWEKVKDFFEGLGASIRQFFSGAGSLLVNAGRALIDGLVNGLNGAKDAVINKVKEIASGALGAIKKFFGIESPSTVMAKQGEFLMLGLNAGIQKTSKVVNSTIEGIAGNVVDKFTGDFSGSLAFSPVSPSSFNEAGNQSGDNLSNQSRGAVNITINGASLVTPQEIRSFGEKIQAEMNRLSVARGGV